MFRPDIVQICGAMAAVSILQLVFLLSFILRHEASSHRGILTAFNTSLTALLLSQIGNFLCKVFYYIDPQQFIFLQTVSAACSAIFEYCYLFYSFARGKALVAEVSTSMSKFLCVIFKISPVVLLFPPVLSGLYSHYLGTDKEDLFKRLNALAAIASGLVVIIIEIIVLISFIRYLSLPSTHDRKFVIIANYGIVCVGFGFLAFVFFAVYLVTTNDMWIIAVLIDFTAISVSMIAMKLALHREDNAKINGTCAKSLDKVKKDGYVSGSVGGG
ncbi:hypothetical protein HDU83_006798 [Entophlyctis luteolus]|nr:hypothetical protein HDU83_006798 [Entophlyctis luteolus]